MASQEIKQRPARGNTMRARWVLALLALSFVLFRGAAALGALLQEAQAGLGITKTGVLPTLPPSQHQITPDEYATAIMSQMTLDDKIAQMIMVKTFGPTLRLEDQQMLDLHVGGVLLFGDAFVSTDQTKSLIGAMQQHGYYPLFIATDQEGGLVNRLAPIVGPRPSEQQIGATGDPANARAAGAQTAADFTALGINFNFAPVVDINEPSVPTQEKYDGRMYSTDPHTIATFADAYLQGFQQQGNLLGGLKHFPGLGSTNVDPHVKMPVVYRTAAQLSAHELVPFRDLLQMGHVHAIMVTHIMLPAIDPLYPATLSYAITTGLLRDALGFQGLIVTDSLVGMKAIENAFTLDQAALLAVQAGEDIIMGPNTPDQVRSIIAYLDNAVATGALTTDRIDASVHRILTQKIELGLIPLPANTITPTVNAPTPSPSPVVQRREDG